MRLGNWLILSTMFLSGFCSAAQAQITPENLAVLRIGNGSTPFDNALNNGARGSIFEFTAGGLVHNGGATSTYNAATSTSYIDLTPGASAGNGIVFSTSANAASKTDGSLNLAVDGKTLVVGGYANLENTPSIAGASPVRTAARVFSNGTASYQTLSTNVFGSGNLRSVATIDGTQLWLAGSNTGVVTVANGASNGTTIASQNASSQNITNIANIDIFGSTNSIFFSVKDVAGQQGIYVVGDTSSPLTSAPTSGTTVVTRIITNLTSTNAGFFFADRNAQDFQGTGLDTAYLLDGGRIIKYDYNGTTWGTGASVNIANPGSGGSGSLTGAFLTGRQVGSNVELYATFDAGSLVNNNYLIKFTDSSTTGLSNFSTDWAVAAGANYSFRGVDLSPIPEPGSILLASALAIGGIGYFRRRREILA
jgi:hypothetical protein